MGIYGIYSQSDKALLLEIHGLDGSEKLRAGIDPVKSVSVRSSALQSRVRLVGNPDTVPLLKDGAIRSDDRNDEAVDVGGTSVVCIERRSDQTIENGRGVCDAVRRGGWRMRRQNDRERGYARRKRGKNGLRVGRRRESQGRCET